MISKVRSFTVKSKFLVCPALVLAAAIGAQAQMKVAVINIQGAIVSTKDGQKAAAELNAKTAPKKKELDQKQSDINALQDQLNKGQNTLSDAAKNKIYKDVEEKKKILQRDVEDAAGRTRAGAAEGPPADSDSKMLAVIERYAKDNGYSMVVDVSSPQTPGPLRVAHHRHHQRNHRAVRQEHRPALAGAWPPQAARRSYANAGKPAPPSRRLQSRKQVKPP